MGAVVDFTAGIISALKSIDHGISPAAIKPHYGQMDELYTDGAAPNSIFVSWQGVQFEPESSNGKILKARNFMARVIVRTKNLSGKNKGASDGSEVIDKILALWNGALIDIAGRQIVTYPSQAKTYISQPGIYIGYVDIQSGGVAAIIGG
jgi:hypothetical protein